MSNLSTVYALSEVLPFLNRWLQGNSMHENADRIFEIARKVTGESRTSNIIKILNEDAKKMSYFQSELLKSFDEFEARSRVVSGRPFSQGGIMVTAVSIALCVYIYALTCCNENLSREVIGILSTVAGIFGSCLKDAFSAEFKFLKTKED